MNLNARPCDAIEIEEPIDSHAEYMAARIVDALLRENVRDCVARAVVVGNDALPRGFADGSDAAQRWLQITHFGPYRLWIPVVRERSARAKLGFSADDLERYAPEFCPCFELNWIAVPRRLYHASNGPLPPGWPTFSQVGLPASLSEGHVLMPVHPFLWQRELERFLVDSGLKGNIKHAPHTALKVTPTLSRLPQLTCDF
jgi:hypothetical protein